MTGKSGQSDPQQGANVSRRAFLNKGLAATGGVAAFVAALSPLSELDPEDVPTIQQFLQKHYKEMDEREMQAALERIRKQVQQRYKVNAKVTDPKPMDGVEFVYALNLTRCIGCRKCVHACVAENNQSRSPQIEYIRVLEMPRGTTDVEQADHHYDRAKVPAPDHYYMPTQCHQCAKPPCVKVCPVEATWQEPDGVTVVDYDWCIGCRYCEAACPYWARRFNFAEPTIPEGQLNPDMGYLSNRPRHNGVMEKCHFCLHRTRVGRMPACVEVCPVGARKFGNILDPDSEVSQILKHNRILVLKEEAGTLPRFFYYFDERYPRQEDAK